MKPNFLGTNASMILGLTLLTSVPGFSKNPGSEAFHITVRVLDYVNIPSGTRGELEANAKRIVKAAGIALDFIECYTSSAATGLPTCIAPLGPTDFMLRIFEPKLAMKGKQLGYAAMTAEGGVYMTVFLNPAQQKARVGNLSNGALLGHAVAHEIGHLLLGANSHSSGGIMRPVWRPLDEEWMAKGALLFGGDQARKMQLAIAARLSR